MQQDLLDLQAENSELRSQVATQDYDRNRLEEYDGLTAAAQSLGYSLVPARVVGLGPSQSFSRTVTIDAGSDAGVHPDLTVVNNDGLVGRVLRVTRTTATVLLIVDADSVVGGRVGRSMEVGFLHGRGVLGSDGRLDLELVDDTAVPAKHDTVVTWGSEAGGPYVAGVPVGKVTSVYSSLRETAQRAVIDPFVDFGALDLVGVVVPTGTASDRRDHRGRRDACDERRPRAGRGSPPSSLALVLQVSFFPHLAWDGIVPNLCLLVVVGAALTRGPQFAAVLGFAAGVALDLAPPADHLAGRWALALVVVGYVAGRVRQRQPGRPRRTVVATVAASSFVGTSVFALSGLVLGDPHRHPRAARGRRWSRCSGTCCSRRSCCRR